MTRYDDFFMLADRNIKRRVIDPTKRPGTKRPKVKVINPERLAEFLQTVAADEKIQWETRLLVCLIAGSGGRISEVLNLRKRDIEGRFFTLLVLKKDRETARKQAEARKAGKPYKEYEPIARRCKAPDASVELLDRRLERVRPHERLFRLSRF